CPGAEGSSVCAIHMSSCFSRCLRVPIAMRAFYEQCLWIPLESFARASRLAPQTAKRRGVGIDDEVLRPEESRRCARGPASPRLSTVERPWPARDEFGSAGGRQNKFAGSGATIFHSTR